MTTEELSNAEITRQGERPPAASRLHRLPRTAPELLLALLTIVVIALHLSYLLKVRTGVPHQDEWGGIYSMFDSLDHGRLGKWMRHAHNGHLSIPAKLGYLVALKLWSLDLTPLRLANFPICLGAFLLTARAVSLRVPERFLRFYVCLGAALVIFNLCLWEHFSQGGAFAVLLAALFSCLSLYFLCQALEAPARRILHLCYSLAFLLAAIASFGIGYVAAVAFATVPLLRWSSRWLRSVPASWLRWLGYSAGIGFGLIALLSHPRLEFSGAIFRGIYHFLLVSGSIIGSTFEGPALSQNVAFVIGSITTGIALWIAFNYAFRPAERDSPLSLFATALVIFGVASCAAVAFTRAALPDPQFLASRYTLQPSITSLGILLYVARRRAFLLGNVWCLIAAGYLFATIKEFEIAQYRPAVYENIKVAIRNAENLSDAELQAALYWGENTPHVRAVAARLKHERLTFFREQE